MTNILHTLDRTRMSDQITTELLPCPFCGGAVRIVEGEESAYVQCENVKMHRALWFEGDNNAANEVAEQWNRRADARVAPEPVAWENIPSRSKKDDGGQAFPSEGEGHGNPHYHSPGMSLRDWFAGQALAGHLASLAPGSWGNDKALALDAAAGAYLVADAMLAQRDAIRAGKE